MNGATGLCNVFGTLRVQSGLLINTQSVAMPTDTPSQADANLTVKAGSQVFANRAGGNLILQGGATSGTGDGVSGFISFSTTNSGAVGMNTISEVARFTINKNLLLGTTTDVASSLLTIDSTTKGFLPPRMTTTQKNAIASPATGLMVYDTTLNLISVYNGTIWITL